MSTHDQPNQPQTETTLPYTSIAFGGKVTLTPLEIASRLGWNEKHVRDLIADGELPAIDGKSAGAIRSSFRVPTESYRDFVARRMTGRRRTELLKALPRESLQELVTELTQYLGEK